MDVYVINKHGIVLTVALAEVPGVVERGGRVASPAEIAEAVKNGLVPAPPADKKPEGKSNA